MATANDAVSAALETALAGGEAESQSATEASPEAKTEDIVAAAAAEAIKSQSPPESKPSAEEQGDKPKTVPYDRFSEVVQQKNSASERLEALEAQFKTATEREDTLRNQIGSLEQEHQILEAIRDLGRDERYAAAVNQIDRALQGIEDEVEEAKSEGDDNAVKVAELKFEKKTEELENLVAQQRNEALWSQSQDFASAMLDSLPEEYTDVDRDRLAKMWTPRVDWNSIEEHGSEVIPDTLKNSFAELIKDYGTPVGAIEQRVRDEVTQQIPEEARPSTPEDVVKSVLDKSWSATDEDGKAVHGDDEFARDVAKLMRATRSG